MLLYNPETRTPINLLEGIYDVTEDAFVGFYRKRAVASKAEAEQLGVCGHVYWLEGDRVMKAHLTPIDFWKPIDDSGVHVSGINWGDQYFCTEAAAMRFRESIVDSEHYQVGYPCYHEAGDTWSIHYHY